MAITKDYKDFVLSQLSILEDNKFIPIMGDYLLYYKDTLFGGIYDDRLLVKNTESNKKYEMEDAIPYDGAKPMYLVDDIDNIDTLKDIVLDTYKDLEKR